MYSWLPGYTHRELDDAQERYELLFPPDLIAMLLQRQPAPGYNWRGEDKSVRRMLGWPLATILFGVEQGFWWPGWGDRPNLFKERSEAVEGHLRAAPRLIPLVGHRFIPEEPSVVGNPVFSMYGFDTIYYGANLAEYFRNEFEGKYEIGPTRYIPFWSEIVERPEDASPFSDATLESNEPLTAIFGSHRTEDG